MLSLPPLWPRSLGSTYEGRGPITGVAHAGGGIATRVPMIGRLRLGRAHRGVNGWLAGTHLEQTRLFVAARHTDEADPFLRYSRSK